HAQQQVGQRPGGDDGDPAADRLGVEGLVALPGRHLAFALVQHLHVAAQRQGGHHVLGAVLAQALPERLAEADRKAQHLHPAAARHPVVAEFVEGDQDAEADDQPPDRTEELAHPVILPTSDSATRRAWASSASRSSRLSEGPPGRASRLAWIRSGMPRKASRPLRKAETATSLAALSTAVAPWPAARAR